ncbi:MAG: Smr/MutS family protein [Rhodothermales bacterium]|nr:Smr/MutS family protein [Rhodothermales bacterium]
MPFPTLDDDGQTVTLDLHGAAVDDALALSIRVVEAAARRGRGTVRIVHGASTRGGGRRTIEQALHAHLDQGGFAGIASAWRGDGHLLLALPLASETDPTPLRLRDLL